MAGLKIEALTPLTSKLLMKTPVRVEAQQFVDQRCAAGRIPGEIGLTLTIESFDLI
jgi:hypothetical protein